MKLLAKQLLSLAPSKLPVGMSEMKKFQDDIIELAGPLADYDSMCFVISSTIMHLGPQKSHVPKNFFVRTLIKAAANQISSQTFQDIKKRQDEAMKAAQIAAAQQEETAKEQQLSESQNK